MDDRLEKFIKAHREEMDDKSPGEALWKGIEREIKAGADQREKSKSVIFWRAAAMILLLISSWLVFDKVNQGNPGNNEGVIATANPQLTEAETYYISLINEKKEEISAMSQKYDLGEDFLKEIDALDSMYAVLKRDLHQGDQEHLVNAMILNLQFRIEILNKQLGIIQSLENIKRNENVVL